MLNVPVRVMDALRDGRRLKNVFIIVMEREYEQETNQYGRISFDTPGRYIAFCPIGTRGDSQARISYWIDGEEISTLVDCFNGYRPSYDITFPEGATSCRVTFYNGPYNPQMFPILLIRTMIHVIIPEFTIDNNNLVSESVRLDERMCSGDVLKFGLCEGSSLEFQYFGLPAINEKRLIFTVRVQYESEEIIHDIRQMKWYSIPMGWFDVAKCPVQVSTGIRKVTAYNKLKSEYLDAKANDYIQEIIAQGEDGSTEVSIYKILHDVLQGFSITQYETTTETIDIPGGYMFNVFTERAYGTSGYWTVYNVSGTFNLNPSDYYSFQMSLMALKQKISSLFTSSMQVEVNGVVMTLMEYAMSSYSDSDQIGGQIGGNNQYFEEVSPTILASNDYIHTRYYTNNDYVLYVVPVIIEYGTSANPDISDAKMQEMNTIMNSWMEEINFTITQEKLNLSDMEKLRLNAQDVMADVTLRDLQSAVYEVQCQFGKLDRETDLFSGVELNFSRLYPSETLYPADNLYPSGTSENANKSVYSRLWTDSQGKLTFRNLVITYKGLDEDDKEKEFILQRVVNADGNTDYYMTSNWLFKNLIWTENQVGLFADAMVAKMQPITWVPFELWGPGLAYLETGDELELELGEDTMVSYVLQRQMNGIQNLQDTYINGTLDVF